MRSGITVGVLMIVVLVNPATKKPTGFQPFEGTPHIFEGPCRNVALVSEEWIVAERARIYALVAERRILGIP